MNIAVLAGFLIFLLYLGYAANRKNKKNDIEDYFVVSRSLNVLLTAGTYGASFLSAGAFIGMNATTYAFGWNYAWQNIGSLAGPFFLFLMYVPKFWRVGYYNNCLSMPDLFAKRYHPTWSRALFAGIILIVYTSGLASMYLGLNAVWGYISDLPLMLIVVIAAVVILAYSAFGGARGVSWTDTFCMICIALGVFAIVSMLIPRMGGFTGIIEQFAQAETPEGQMWMEGKDLVTMANAYYTGPMTIAWTMIWFLGNSTQPHQVTRAYLAKNERVARIGIAIGIAVIGVFFWTSWYVASYARINFPNLEKADFALPSVIMDVFPSFLAAFMLIVIVAAIFSTASTMLIIAGQCMGYDIYSKLINRNTSQKKIISVSRVTMVVCSFLAIGIAYIAQSVPTLLFLWASSFAIMGAAIAPSLFSAFYWKGATASGNIASMIVGTGVSLFLYAFPAMQPFGLHPLMPALILSTLTLIIVSKCTKPSSAETLDKFYNPLVRYGEKAARRKGLID